MSILGRFLGICWIIAGSSWLPIKPSIVGRSDVLPPLQQVGGKRVAEGVVAGCHGPPSLGHGTLHGLLHHARIEVVPSLIA